ncbi:Cysteine proteinase [Hondaea fermentalgiana]|uniref:Cysteine proteinase n=1 Tax=Hondaea fermentalgiana TaxID=2315210 RepID=A0A2R5GUW4_9STRA|nr:Cysteine proteinase [Hondaea fermentalgiana]|eukprot:GBG32443.1 Cysteine proteinase [Hondaea fermentalgiana]
MRTLAALTVAAGLVATAQGKVSFEMCSDALNDFGIEDVILPEFAVAGEKIAVELVQRPNRAIGKGHVRVEVDVEGVKVAHETYELCEVAECHMSAHTLGKSMIWLSLPQAMPAGFETSIKVIVNDHNGAQLSCIDVSGVQVQKPSNNGGKVLRATAEGDKELSLSRNELEFLFDKWAREFGHKFSVAETVKHMRTFAENLEQIALHNKAGHSFTLGLNEFAHLSQEEFAATHFGFKGGETPELTVDREFYQLDVSTGALTDLPEEVDWSKKGAVTPVKNQGSCGSCWSFSTTGALEGAYYLKTGKLVSFSEQELVNCDHVDQGCNGGLMDNAFRWIIENGGLCSEEDYPYKSGSGFAPRTCKVDSCSTVEGSAPQSFVDVKHSEMSLEEAVAQQPVAIAIEADQLAFQFYRKGVLVGSCGSRLDHGVLAVGYGTWTDGKKYWKVKNSWGGTWGMNGYILIQRGKHVRGGECGLLLSASYPVL